MRCFWRAENGAASVLTALSAVALIGMAALGIDTGAVYLKARELQGVADLAALSAAEDLHAAQRRAELTTQVNEWGRITGVRTELGHYEPDPAVAPAQRFASGGADANAVRVRITGEAPLYFGQLFAPRASIRVTREATAAQARLASFQIGSRLLALRGGVANALLTGLTGSSVSLSVMDYDSLARADVNLFDYVDALRTRLNLNAASYDHVLQTRADAPAALNALADVLAQQGDSRAAAAISQLARAARGKTLDGLSALLDLGPYGTQDQVQGGAAARVGVNAFDLATAMLEIANGHRQVALDLGASVPGVARLKAWLAIGERPNQSPWLTVTNTGEPIIRTAQMRLYLEADVGVSGLAGLASVKLPIFLEAASAQARLAAISCGASPSSHSVRLSASPSLGTLALAQIDRSKLDNFQQPMTLSSAPLVRTALITANGFARVDLGGQQWQDVTFHGDEIARGEVKRVQTRDIVQATLSSLLGNLALDVRVLGLGLNLTNVTRALQQPIASVGAPLDTVVNSLTDLLGVHLGEADLRVNGVRCNGAALVG